MIVIITLISQLLSSRYCLHSEFGPSAILLTLYQNFNFSIKRENGGVSQYPFKSSDTISNVYTIN